MTLEQLSEMLDNAAVRCKSDLELDVLAIGELTKTMAAEYIGHEMPEWPPLADSTVEEKIRLGYTGQVSDTDPLLRTGDMRDSIGVEQAGLVVAVGSPEKVAFWQEMGTTKMPPRPFLSLAMRNSLEHAVELMTKTAARLFTPGLQDGR